MGEVKKPPVKLWLDAERKRQMGARLKGEIDRTKTTKAQVSRDLGYARATLTNACKGVVSLELLAEICRHIGASLDYVVYGNYPTADQVLALLDQLKSRANKPPH